MMNLLLHWAWDWFVGWAGLSLLVALSAGAVWWLVPAIFTKVRALAFNISVGALAFNSVYTMGFKDGASSTKTEWDAAEQRQRDRGSDAHEQAEQTVEPAVELEPQVCEPAPAPGSVAPVPRPRAPMPQWMRDDPYRRNDR